MQQATNSPQTSGGAIMLMGPKKESTALAGDKVDVDDEPDEDEAETDFLNVTLVLLYVLVQHERGHGHSRQARKLISRTCFWLFFGTLLSLASTFLLMCLTMSSNWNSCVSDDDCKVGTVCECVRLVEANESQWPLCLDCHFLVDSSEFGDGKPWQHSVNGFGDAAHSINGMRRALRTSNTAAGCFPVNDAA